MNNIMKNTGKDTLPLDTAAILYSYTKTKTWNQTFRISALLKSEVDGEILKQALRKIRNRFPTFFVRLTDGFLWKGFKSAPVDVDEIVVHDYEYCAPVETETKYAPLFKIHYCENRISLDIFHGVTDGHGASVFLKTLLAAYFNLQGIYIPATHGILDINEEPKKEEFEDGYQKFYDKSKGKLKRNEKAAYQHFIHEEDGNFTVMQGKLSSCELKKVTKEMGVTVTEYLVALYAYSYYVNRDKSIKKPIKIQFPINLRRIFPLETLRNFSLVASVSIDYREDDYTFTEILQSVKKQITRGVDKDFLQKMLNTNASDAAMPIAKYSPSFMKQPFIIVGFLLYGERLITSPISNMGLIAAPDELKEQVEYFDFTIGATKMNSINASVITFNDNIVITFSTKKQRRDVQNSFFSFLKEHGIDVEMTIE